MLALEMDGPAVGIFGRCDDEEDCASGNGGAADVTDPERCRDGNAVSMAAGLEEVELADANAEYGGIARGGDDRRDFRIGSVVSRSAISVASMKVYNQSGRSRSGEQEDRRLRWTRSRRRFRNDEVDLVRQDSSCRSFDLGTPISPPPCPYNDVQLF